MSLNGHGTDCVKLGQELYLSYNLNDVDDVGKYVCTEAGSGTWEADEDYVFPDAGVDLVVRTNQKIVSASDMLVTVIGTKVGGGALVGQAVIGAGVSEDQSYELVPWEADAKWASVTAVSASDGVAGDGFDLMVLPDSDDDEEIMFLSAATFDPGKTVKPIYHHYDLDHNKRLRGDKVLSITTSYVSNLAGVARIRDRDVTIIVRIYDDGGNQASEVHFYKTCRLSVPLDATAGEAEVTVKGQGIYGKRLCFT